VVTIADPSPKFQLYVVLAVVLVEVLVKVQAGREHWRRRRRRRTAAADERCVQQQVDGACRYTAYDVLSRVAGEGR
jgi:hypothetical protein